MLPCPFSSVFLSAVPANICLQCLGDLLAHLKAKHQPQKLKRELSPLGGADLQKAF